MSTILGLIADLLVLAFFILLVIFVYASVMYLFLMFRNYRVKNLALNLGLTFENLLPAYKQAYLLLYRDTAINRASGKIDEREVEWSDYYHGNLLKTWNRGFTETALKVDGFRLITGEGNDDLIAPINFISLSRLRAYLLGLKRTVKPEEVLSVAK